MKRTVAVLLCLTQIAVASTYVTAGTLPSGVSPQGMEDGVGITPFWDHTSQIASILSFKNGKGSLGGRVFGHPGTTEISVETVLERKNSDGSYTEIKTWSDTIESDVWVWGTNYYVEREHTYRLTHTCTVYRDGESETTTVAKSAYAD